MTLKIGKGESNSSTENTVSSFSPSLLFNRGEEVRKPQLT
jgi:hypothetical protein